MQHTQTIIHFPPLRNVQQNNFECIPNLFESVDLNNKYSKEFEIQQNIYHINILQLFGL